jgi:hypothetical protein
MITAKNETIDERERVSPTSSQYSVIDIIEYQAVKKPIDLAIVYKEETIDYLQ